MGKVTFLRCPLCGFNRSTKKYTDLRANFDWDLENFKLIQVRDVGGRGTIKPLTEEDMLLSEAKDKAPELCEAIKRQCFKILRMLSR